MDKRLNLNCGICNILISKILGVIFILLMCVIWILLLLGIVMKEGIWGIW